MRNLFLILVSLSIITSCNQPEHNHVSIESPDKKIQVSLDIVNTKVYYDIRVDEKPILRRSQLGFEFSNQPALSDSFRIVDFTTNSVSETWEQVWGECKEVKNEYNEAIIQLQEFNQYKRKLNLTFRVFDDGIGFSYEIPSQAGMDSIRISNELTEFNLFADHKAWFIPANFGSYEMLYQNKPASEVEWVNTPVTFESVEKDLFLSIHEANLTNYAGMTVRKQENSPLNFEAELVPWPDGDKVKTITPMKTPWRTIQISNSAAKLMESTLILNLNEPNKLEDVSWIKPSKYVGIWWGMHIGTHTWSLGDRHGATTENTKAYIDFAAENGIPSVLVEGWNTGWENWGQPEAFDFVTPYEDFDLRGLADYARKKGVKLIGHHETGGDSRYYEAQMDEAFSLYQSLGIHQVKTGYAGSIVPKGQHHHGQYMVNHYRKVVETAAKYGIAINAHEPIKPTGIRRTYPNMMSREGARGMEWNAWSEGNPPEHHVIVPFTRSLAGPFDYTPGIFDIRYQNAGKRVKWNGNDLGVSRVNTTLAKQLALYIVFYSPVQMASDLVKNYKDHPAFQFFRDVPVNWEFTRALNAEIGEYVTIVRKDWGSDDWYLGSVTDENPRSLPVQLDFLDEGKTYIAEIYRDATGSHWESNPYDYETKQEEVTYHDTLDLNLAPGGGQAIRFKVK